MSANVARTAAPFSAPYIIRSGKKTGKSLENMMFTDYPWVDYMFKRLESTQAANPNLFHRHLKWLMVQGENRIPTMSCPICNNSPVAYMWMAYESYGMEAHWQMTCCRQLACIENLRERTEGRGEIVVPRFSLFLGKREDSRSTILRVFKDIFELPSRITQGVAFDFFSRMGYCQ